MKITFVYPDMQPQIRYWKGYYYTGIGSLSSYLKNNGHETSLVHICQPINKRAFIQRIIDEKPNIIGFSSTSHAFPVVKVLAAWMREENLHIPVICGGIHPTISPHEAINTRGVDMICRGEGEEPLVGLCEKMEASKDTSNLQNIWFKNKRLVKKNPLRTLYKDITTLPFSDRSIFEYKSLYHESQGCATVMVSRGCSYRCSYCCNNALKVLYDKKSKYTRFRSVESALSEIKQIKRSFSYINAIHFDDDILFLNKKWGEAFMSRYKAEMALPFSCNARPNLPDRRSDKLLSEAGCHQVSIGLESGNDYIRNTILNRNLNHEQIMSAFRFCREENIHVKSFNIIGIPFEDSKAVLDTIKCNAEASVEKFQATIFQPYKGTRLYELCKEKGFLDNNEELLGTLFSRSPLTLDTMSAEQVFMFRNYFKILVQIYKLLLTFSKGNPNHVTQFADSVLSIKLLPYLLNTIYIPLIFLFRLVQYLKGGLTRVNRIILSSLPEIKEQKIARL
jgi:radical SAM superfamily enzyme YgiQ (UPF0313 family)